MNCVEIRKPKGKSLLITICYRPPNSSVELFNDFENFLELFEDENKAIIITGHFNCNLLEQNKNLLTSKLRKLSLLRHYENYDINTDLSEVFSLPLDLAIFNDKNALWNDFITKFLNFAVKNSRTRQDRVKSK